MTPPVCTHTAARERLEDGDPEGALRVAGPMLEDDPGDVRAWRLAALATLELGEERTAFKNLKSVAIALAEQRNPIHAIAQTLELAERGQDADQVLEKIAALYGADSERLEDLELDPPPLPTGAPVEPWGDDLDRDAVLGRAADAMAVAWGAALTGGEEAGPLPYIPLLSSLAADDLVELLGHLERVTFLPDEPIVEQGEPGDAMFVVADGSVAVSRSSGAGDEVLLARLGPGAFFGEMSLVSSAPRAAAVRAVDRATLLRAGREEMERLAEKVPRVGDVLIAFCHARMLENLMRVSPVLAPVPPADRPEVIARFDTGYRRAGEVIISEGQEGPGLFLVVSGRVSVFRREEEDDVLLARLGPGDLFGEISLLMRKPSTATVVATENTALLVLARDDFNEVTRDFPQLLKGAYDIAVEREMQNNSILATAAEDADDLVLV